MIAKSHESVCVIGLGYVGLPLLLHLAKSHHKIYGLDVNQNLVLNLNAGNSHIAGIDGGRLKELQDEESIHISSNPLVLNNADIIVVCVPTPLNNERQIDTSLLESAVENICQNMKQGALIVNESTSYPGTLRELFESKLINHKLSREFYLATAPERIDPGSQIEIQKIPRVIGGINEESTNRAREFYERSFENVITVDSPEIAEMSKLLENSFRQVNISLVNELNDVCRRAGIDTRAVINAASTKPYGFMKFIPGAGIGGHCIPVDPEYLQYFAGKFGKSLRMIDAASSVNNDMGRLIFDRLKIRLKGSSFSKGVILGIAYKANVADSRDTPAKIIIRHFRSESFMIDWHDPLIQNWEEEISSNLIENTWDFGIVVTAHNDLDINAAKKSCKVIFDCTGRYSFDPEIVQI